MKRSLFITCCLLLVAFSLLLSSSGEGLEPDDVVCVAIDPVFLDETGQIIPIPENEEAEGDEVGEAADEGEEWADGAAPEISSNSAGFLGSIVTSDKDSAHVLMPMTLSDPTFLDFSAGANGGDSTTSVQWNNETGQFAALAMVEPSSPMVTGLEVLATTGEATCCGEVEGNEIALHVVFSPAPDLNNGAAYPVLIESGSQGVTVTLISGDTFTLLLGMGLGGVDPPIPPPGGGLPTPLPPLPPGAQPVPGAPTGTIGQFVIRIQIVLQRLGSNQLKCRFLNS